MAVDPNSEGRTTIALQRALDRMRVDKNLMPDELADHVHRRIRRLTTQMIRRYPRLSRWEQTDDIAQEATIKLLRAVEQVRPEDTRHLLRLAAVQIRRTLIDLCRHHFGPQGSAKHHRTSPASDGFDDDRPLIERSPSDATTPEAAAIRNEIHEQVDQLAEDHREIVDLLYYNDLTQAEAAEVLGVSTRTIKRRWRDARLALSDLLEQ